MLFIINVFVTIQEIERKVRQRSPRTGIDRARGQLQICRRKEKTFGMSRRRRESEIENKTLGGSS